MILPCGCTSKDNGNTSDWQDHEYGKGNRVHNEMVGAEGKKKRRCTVCGKVRD